jgi:hypothetical protein
VFVKRFLEVRVSGPVIASIAKPGERRTEARIKDYVSTQYLSPQGNWRVIKVYDLSARGMRLVLDKPLPLSELVELKIIIPYDSRPVFAKGKVIWSKELSVQEREFHVGLVFTQIDPGDKSRLILKQVYSLFREGVA